MASVKKRGGNAAAENAAINYLRDITSREDQFRRASAAFASSSFTFLPPPPAGTPARQVPPPNTRAASLPNQHRARESPRTSDPSNHTIGPVSSLQERS